MIFHQPPGKLNILTVNYIDLTIEIEHLNYVQLFTGPFRERYTSFFYDMRLNLTANRECNRPRAHLYPPPSP